MSSRVAGAKRRMRYVTAVVAVLACPCHLPIWLALLSGTALAGAISDHLGVAVVALTVLFIASAWAAVRLFSGEGRNSRLSRDQP
jgi:mercuric ion transport protein